MPTSHSSNVTSTPRPSRDSTSAHRQSSTGAGGSHPLVGDEVEDQLEDVTVEAAAHAILRLVADLPGQMGRLRVARVVGGYPVSTTADVLDCSLDAYAVPVPWPIRESVALIDALIDGHLLAQTIGQRPTLVVTRAGHRALDALEHVHPYD